MDRRIGRDSDLGQDKTRATRKLAQLKGRFSRWSFLLIVSFSPRCLKKNKNTQVSDYSTPTTIPRLVLHPNMFFALFTSSTLRCGGGSQDSYSIPRSVEQMTDRECFQQTRSPAMHQRSTSVVIESSVWPHMRRVERCLLLSLVRSGPQNSGAGADMPCLDYEVIGVLYMLR
jgi:hypothetical protein